MLLVMLPEQVVAVVIAIGSADDDVDVLANGAVIGVVLAHAAGPLVIEFDENNRAVDAVVENGVIARVADPGEVGSVEVGFHFFHADVGMALVQVANVEADQIDKLTAMLGV